MHKASIDYDKEDLKVLIDDKKLNINVLDYIEINNKYEWYLKAIRFLGNFATYEHIAAILNGDCSKTKVFNDLNIMCEMNLLRKEFLGRNIYFVLTKKAQIYLKKRNNVGYIPNPSNRSMKSNLLLADYLINNQPKFTTEAMKKSNNKLYMLISEFNSYEYYIKMCYLYLYKNIQGINGINIDFFKEQINLLNKKNELVKTEKNTRLVKSYDSLSKLMLKNIYLIQVDAKSDNIEITFLIQDIDRSLSWYKYEILNIDKIIKEFYHNLIDYFKPNNKLINYNIVIQTDSNERKLVLKKIEDYLIDLNKRRDNYVNKVFNNLYNDPENIKIFVQNNHFFWCLDKITIIEYNTNRFFETRSDKIKTLDSNEINIIDFTLNI